MYLNSLHQGQLLIAASYITARKKDSSEHIAHIHTLALFLYRVFVQRQFYSNSHMMTDTEGKISVPRPNSDTRALYTAGLQYLGVLTLPLSA